MATTTKWTSSNQYIVYWLEYIDEGVSGNVRTIRVKLWLDRTNTGYVTDGNGTAIVTIDGTQYTNNIVYNTGYALHDNPVCYLNTTHKVTQSNYAAKNIYISCSMDHSMFTMSKQGFTWSLPTIATAPTSCTTSASVTSNGKIDANNIVQGEYKVVATRSGGGGDTNYKYQYCWSVNNGSWTYSNWTTNNYYLTNTSNFSEGDEIDYRTVVANSAGNSGWSSPFYLHINKKPNTPNNIWVSTIYPQTAINILWNAATDPNNHPVQYELQYRTTGYGWANLTETTGTEYRLDINSHPVGTGYDFRVRAKDSLGSVSSWKELIGAATKSKPPTKPSISLNKSGIVEGNITITATCESGYSPTTLHYTFAYSVDSTDNWVEIGETTFNSYTKSLTRNRGSVFNFRVKAKNSAGISAWSSIVSVTSNRVPNNITSLLPNGNAVNNSVTFSWGACTDPDGHSVSYELNLSKNNGTAQLLGTTSNTSYRWSVPDSDAEGTTYEINIQAKDSLEGKSAAFTKTYVKSSAPSIPSNIKPNVNGVYSEDFTVSWNASDFYGLNGHYIVLIYLNNNLFKTIKVTSGTSAIVKISELTQGASLRLGVKAVNEYGQESKSVNTSASMRINSKPTAPTIKYPAGNSNLDIYGDYINLLITSGYDNESNVAVKVKIGSRIYSSDVDTHLFSSYKVGNNSNILFRMRTSLTGDIFIQVYTNDGYLDSDLTSITITKNTVNLISAGDYVTVDSCKRIINALNVNRSTAGLSDISHLNSFNTGDIITLSKIKDINNALIEYQNKLRFQIVNNSKPYTDNISSKLIEGTYVTAEIFNLLISNL